MNSMKKSSETRGMLGEWAAHAALSRLSAARRQVQWPRSARSAEVRLPPLPTHVHSEHDLSLLLAAEVRRRRRVGRRWFVDEVFLCRKSEKRYLYRVIDEDGQGVDVLLRDHRDTASAKAFFRQAIERTQVIPEQVITDYHQP